MAAPHVAGVAALVWSHFPDLNATDIRYALEDTAEDIGQNGKDDYFGYGLVDALEAYNYLQETTSSQPTLSPVPSTMPSISSMPSSCGNGFCDIVDETHQETCSSCPSDCFIPQHCNIVGNLPNPDGMFFYVNWWGVAFKVKALKNLSFYEISIRVNSDLGLKSANVNLYTKQGGFTAGKGIGQWTLIFDGEVTINGDFTAIIPIDDPLRTDEDTERSFYMTFPYGNMILFQDYGLVEYGISFENDDVQVFHGEAQDGDYGSGIFDYIAVDALLSYTYYGLSSNPSSAPSFFESNTPSLEPSFGNSTLPSSQPSEVPSILPSSLPSQDPSRLPSGQPSSVPSTIPSNVLSSQPSREPSGYPTQGPSNMPSQSQSNVPSTQPSRDPSRLPSSVPSQTLSSKPSLDPSNEPSNIRSTQPSNGPTIQPSSFPTKEPSRISSQHPSSAPFLPPSTRPTKEPSVYPTFSPTSTPSQASSRTPTFGPSGGPSNVPSNTPSKVTSFQPSRDPIIGPSEVIYSQAPSSSMKPSTEDSIQPSVISSRHTSKKAPSSPPDLGAKTSQIPSSKPSILQKPSIDTRGDPIPSPAMASNSSSISNAMSSSASIASPFSSIVLVPITIALQVILLMR